VSLMMMALGLITVISLCFTKETRVRAKGGRS